MDVFTTDNVYIMKHLAELLFSDSGSIECLLEKMFFYLTRRKNECFLGVVADEDVIHGYLFATAPAFADYIWVDSAHLKNTVCQEDADRMHSLLFAFAKEHNCRKIRMATVRGRAFERKYGYKKVMEILEKEI